jgi:hypothetical protein
MIVGSKGAKFQGKRISDNKNFSLSFRCIILILFLFDIIRLDIMLIPGRLEGGYLATLSSLRSPYDHLKVADLEFLIALSSRSRRTEYQCEVLSIDRSESISRYSDD